MPILYVAVPLCDLRCEVDGVAGEEEVVLGCDGEGVSHEDGGVAGQGQSHFAGDAVEVEESASCSRVLSGGATKSMLRLERPVCSAHILRVLARGLHVRVLLCVRNSCDGYPKVRRRSPEVCQMSARPRHNPGRLRHLID